MSDKIYLYKIGYGSYENSGSIELFHIEKISKQKFNHIFVGATLELLLNRRSGEFRIYGNSMMEDYEEGGLSKHDIEYYTEMFKKGEHKEFKDQDWQSADDVIKALANPRYTQFENILEDVAKIMIELYGFKKVVYEQETWVDGWEDIVDTSHRDKLCDHILLDRIARKFWKRKKNGNSNPS